MTFSLVHVDMVSCLKRSDFPSRQIITFACKVAHSGKLISAAEDCIAAASSNQREIFDTSLERLYNAYQAINQSMETMWARSKPADYIKFRYDGQL